jgi:hypothetical protein
LYERAPLTVLRRFSPPPFIAIVPAQSKSGGRSRREKKVLALKVSADVFVAVAMAMALAYALECPGRMRLDRSIYAAVQPIYYPAHAISGWIGESLGVLLTFVLLLLTPAGSEKFNWIAAAFSSLLAMQFIYWVFAWPVKDFWTGSHKFGPAARRFFGLSSTAEVMAKKHHESLWPELKQRWEFSHVARAVFGFVSVVTLSVGVSM